MAGVVALLGFLNGALGSAASRYITYAIGQHQATAAKQTFGNILTLYLGLAVLIFVLGETLGLWFVLTQLQIPPDRTEAALWVYQCSILSSILTILNVPYNATIIAHEKMAAFAYISMADAVLKLLVACLLLFSPYDKLIVYSLLFWASSSSTGCYTAVTAAVISKSRTAAHSTTDICFGRFLFLPDGR